MSKKASWKDYILSVILAAVLFGVFYPLKIACASSGPDTAGILLKYAIYGVVAGILLGTLCLFLKKKGLLFCGALLLLALMTFLPARFYVTFSALLGLYFSFCILSVPFIASRLSKV